jgi:hypothetical protein
LHDLSRSPNLLDQDGTLIALVELSLSSWLIAIHRAWRRAQAAKKLAVDENALLKLLNRCRVEAKAAHRIKRIAVAFEARLVDAEPSARWSLDSTTSSPMVGRTFNIVDDVTKG